MKIGIVLLGLLLTACSSLPQATVVRTKTVTNYVPVYKKTPKADLVPVMVPYFTAQRKMNNDDMAQLSQERAGAICIADAQLLDIAFLEKISLVDLLGTTKATLFEKECRATFAQHPHLLVKKLPQSQTNTHQTSH